MSTRSSVSAEPAGLERVPDAADGSGPPVPAEAHQAQPITAGTRGDAERAATPGNAGSAAPETLRAASTAETPGDELLRLHRAGTLVAEYPRLPGLLAQLSPAELERAGRLLSRLDPDAVLAEHPETRRLTVAITGNGTLPPLVPPLTAELARHGLLLRPKLDDYGGFVFGLSDPDGAVHRAEADVVVCQLDPHLVADELPSPWTAQDAERVLGEKITLLEALVARFTGISSATLVLNTLPLPAGLTAALVDHRSRARLGAAWREAMARLLRLTDTHPSVVVVDLDPLVADGVEVTDPRLAAYAKARLSPGLLAAHAREVSQIARQLAGLTRKCLVLDLDRTLWDGVLAEDGVTGIEVGAGHRGESFADFQRVVKQLGSQGVLLAAVSKNDDDEVRAAFQNHPGMVLTERDFVRISANWRPKHENIRELAEALNLGVDSFVFADDSAYERGLVRRELPQVAVVDLDAEPALHPRKLLRDGWFTVRALTGEDKGRLAEYRSQVERQDFLSTFDSLEGYLRELGVTVHLGVACPAEIARVSQMSLRINQFNLTTRRLDERQVTDLVGAANGAVCTIRSADRFGDNGIVGAAFYREDGDVGWIDNFLLSCRVFSRGIEQACLAAVLRHARGRGLRELRATYRPSAKNGKVRGFYPRYGFTVHQETPEEVTFRHELVDLIEVPGHVSLTTDPALPVADLD